MKQIKEFRAVRAPAAAIAERLSDKLGVNYTRKDVANLIENKLPSLKCESDSDNVKIFLDEIVEGGGDVYAKFHDAGFMFHGCLRQDLGLMLCFNGPCHQLCF